MGFHRYFFLFKFAIMARVKYSEEAEEINNKHYGFTFQRNHYGNSMQPSSRSSRTRYVNQFNRMQNLQKAIRFWRTMAPATKTAWNNFAATYPQPSKCNPAIFLTGYQLFLKRNHYLFLNNGIEADFMEAPTMENLPSGSATFEIKEGNNCLDMTELYIQNFGVIPSPGKCVLFMAVPMSETSGQFFAPITDLLEVEEVYFDGFFLNVILPSDTRNITFSVYLSKPVSKGQSYAGTKVRFMGCFSSKTFLELTDTPSTYAGQQNKVVSVKADQTGLEFTTPSSGGLTCATLAACPTIIEMQYQINSLALAIININPVSIPAVAFGLLYNTYAYLNSKKLSSSDDWVLPTTTQINAFIAFIGSANGITISEANSAYWLNWNTNTNSNKFWARGSGRRSNTGVYSYFQVRSLYMGSTSPYLDYIGGFALRGDTKNISYAENPYKTGHSIRFIKSPASVPNGTYSRYTGNNGRQYRTIAINGVEWMADNLAETEYRDHSVIPLITADAAWAADTAGAYCYVNGNAANT